RFFALETHPVALAPVTRAEVDGDHRHATEGADRRAFVVHARKRRLAPHPWHRSARLRQRFLLTPEAVEHALANLREALELYFEDTPLPDSAEPPIITSVEIAA